MDEKHLSVNKLDSPTGGEKEVSVAEISGASQLEIENIGLRRLVVELIEKNQQLREEIRQAKLQEQVQEPAA